MANRYHYPKAKSINLKLVYDANQKISSKNRMYLSKTFWENLEYVGSPLDMVLLHATIGNIEGLKKLAKQGEDLSRASIHAIWTKNIKVLELLDKYQQLTLGESYKNLHSVIDSGDIKFIKSFLALPSMIKKDAIQKSLLYVLHNNGKFNIIKLLIEKGVKITIRINDIPLLIYVYFEKQMDLFNLLIEKGANLDSRFKTTDDSLITLVGYSIAQDDVRFLTFLIDKGANLYVDITVKDRNYSPLKYAKSLRRKEIVKLLKKHGAK